MLLLWHLMNFGMFSFSFISKYILISITLSSLTYFLFRNVLFNFHICADFPKFLLLFTCNFILLRLKNKLCMILILLHLLCLVLLPKIWSILKKIPCVFDLLYILLLLNGAFYRCLLGLACVECYSSPLFVSY